LGAHARIQAFRRLRARFLNEVAGLGAGRKDGDIRYKIADLFQWHYFGSKRPCFLFEIVGMYNGKTSDFRHPSSRMKSDIQISHGLQFNKEEHQRLRSQDLILSFQTVYRVL